MAYQIMEPVDGRIVVVWKALAYRGGRQQLLFLGDVSGYGGLRIGFMLYGAETPVLGQMGEEVCSFCRLLDIWHGEV